MKTFSTLLLLFGALNLFAQTTGHVHIPPQPNGAPWYDDRGELINAHGGGLLHHDGKYYWYGEIKKGNTWLVPDQAWEAYRVPAGGISCYSSLDLSNWHFEGVVLPAVIGQPDHDLDTSKVIERPKVIYNDQTKQFVMWMHVDTKDYSYARAGVAVSDRPTGPFSYLGSFRPNGEMSRDMTLFKDDDQRAYLFYASESNKTMHVCLLNDDYLSPSPVYSRIINAEYREAPVVFKYNKQYYLITSGCTGWSPNPASWAVSDNLPGNWTQFGNPCVGDNAETTFNTQATFAAPLPGKSNQFLLMADRWNKTNLADSRYVWLIIEMIDNQPVIKWIAD